MEVQSSGSGRGRGWCALPAAESSGGLWRWVESPEGWSCREGEGCTVGRVPLGSWKRGADMCRTRMYSWVHPVWALSWQTCTPDAVPCLSCRGSRWDPGQCCWTDQVEEGKRRGDSKTRPHLASYQWRVSCRRGGGFLKGSAPPLQTDREKILYWFHMGHSGRCEKIAALLLKQLRREQNVHIKGSWMSLANLRLFM